MLSIVIITCNRVESLMKTIESCLNKTQREWELVVVDNGSSDGTPEIVNSFCKEKEINLNFYQSSENLGVAGARNIGYKLAKGDVLYFIDDDAVITSEDKCLDKAYDYLMSKNNVQVLSTKIWDELWNGILPEITENNATMKTGVKLRSFIGCSHFIKKDSTLPETIYPDNLFYGGEEAYLSLAIYKNGKTVEYYEGVYVEHHPSKKTRMSKYDLYRNRVLNWFVVKEYYYPQPILWLSKIVYWLRIAKLAEFNLNRLKEVRKVHKERYDSKYCNKYALGEFNRIVKLFGIRYLI